MQPVADDFNPRTHEECDPTHRVSDIKALNFNPRTHEECDKKAPSQLRNCGIFQSTHSRGVRRQYRNCYADGPQISIHALTRSATELDWEEVQQLLISIHALTRSATATSKRCALHERFQSTHSRGVRQDFIREDGTVCQFQSTHSRGVRPAAEAGREADFDISIHALTRSATLPKFNNEWQQEISIHALTRSATRVLPQFPQVVDYFNPRTHEECDPAKSTLNHWMIYFNPRTHEECDACPPHQTPSILNFNPRTHEECDKYAGRGKDLLLLFQSTHSRGVRPDSSSWIVRRIAFQSTHSRGVRP